MWTYACVSTRKVHSHTHAPIPIRMACVGNVLTFAGTTTASWYERVRTRNEYACAWIEIFCGWHSSIGCRWVQTKWNDSMKNTRTNNCTPVSNFAFTIRVPNTHIFTRFAPRSIQWTANMHTRTRALCVCVPVIRSHSPFSFCFFSLRLLEVLFSLDYRLEAGVGEMRETEKLCYDYDQFQVNLRFNSSYVIHHLVRITSAQ